MDSNSKDHFPKNFFSAIISFEKERFVREMAMPRATIAVMHAWQARHLGHCPFNPSRPKYRYCQGAISFVRMALRMCDDISPPAAVPLRDKLLADLESLYDLQELG